ncbi:type VI secretion system-associated protein TagF [Bordetella genomosp. 13]|uniref:type VI secretion system-associated protein TagF n=1 Tax=Bordetella genomosp. 13 TaxID=463040 RepID=UPI0021B6C40A|nr:type VI secretion system-associated protein TagF [Bordetella genomosp. 13]
MRGNGENGDSVGWYGKMPAAGDFVHRRLPRGLIAWWDKWLQYGLAALRNSIDDGAERAYLTAPIWNFAIPAGPGAGAVLLGSIAPSRDRVGRSYPLCAMYALPADAFQPAYLEEGGDYYRQLGAGLLSATRNGCSADHLDRTLLGVEIPARKLAAASAAPVSAASSAGSDILDILNAGVPSAAPAAPAAPAYDTRALAAWPDLPFCFNPSSHTSYWWTNQADGAALQTYVHGGALNATLFLRLFSSPSTWRL